MPLSIGVQCMRVRQHEKAKCGGNSLSSKLFGKAAVCAGPLQPTLNSAQLQTWNSCALVGLPCTWLEGNRRRVGGDRRWLEGNRRRVGGDRRWLEGNRRWLEGKDGGWGGGGGLPYVCHARALCATFNMTSDSIPKFTIQSCWGVTMNGASINKGFQRNFRRDVNCGN